MKQTKLENIMFNVKMTLGIGLIMVVFGIAIIPCIAIGLVSVLGDGVIGLDTPMLNVVEQDYKVKVSDMTKDVYRNHKQTQQYVVCHKDWIDLITNTKTCR